jgi:hypothetical protein
MCWADPLYRPFACTSEQVVLKSTSSRYTLFCALKRKFLKKIPIKQGLVVLM